MAVFSQQGLVVVVVVVVVVGVWWLYDVFVIVLEVLSRRLFGPLRRTSPSVTVRKRTNAFDLVV